MSTMNNADRHEKTLKLLIDRATQWQAMQPGYSRTNFWDLRVNHVFMDWLRAGRPGAESLSGGPLAWLLTVSPGREPQLQEQQLMAAPDPLPNAVFNGRLEFDLERGVAYFHDNETGRCVLRVGGLSVEWLKKIFAEKSPTSNVDMFLTKGANYSR